MAATENKYNVKPIPVPTCFTSRIYIFRSTLLPSTIDKYDTRAEDNFLCLLIKRFVAMKNM